MLNHIVKFFLENRLVTLILIVFLVLFGLITAPFTWHTDFLPRDPVSVDAIPDLGENQQIVFTSWPGRSPQDVEDQITYPLTTALLGMPGVKTVRSNSMYGYSNVYIIFNEGIDFYWARTRLLEKLNTIPPDLLPSGVKPTIGPDATALGQVFWYTLEGRDKSGAPAGGWDLQELRSIQDFQVKYALSSVEGVSEVASIGGHVKEYQIDLIPDALKTYSISIEQVIKAVRQSNRDVGAQTLEINKAEYMVRGLGYVKSIDDLEEAVVVVREGVAIRIKDLAKVAMGPAVRRGIIDKAGVEAVGGVVVARYGSNPNQVIESVKQKINEIQAGLPVDTLADGTLSKVTIVPFYDRTLLINETLNTLESALALEVLITILVIVVMLLNIRTSLIITLLLPLAMLMVFIAMKYTGVDANIVALSGIAIAIGTMVDLGIILTENVHNHINSNPENNLFRNILNAAREVSGAIMTAVSTTIISFVPVFALEAAEGKLFRPLAFTKSYALVAALFVTLLILPSLTHWILGFRVRRSVRRVVNILLLVSGLVIMVAYSLGLGLAVVLLTSLALCKDYFPGKASELGYAELVVTVLGVVILLSLYWMPLGVTYHALANIMFVAVLVGLMLMMSQLIIKYYTTVLAWCLDHKATFLAIPVTITIVGIMMWQGFDRTFSMIPYGLNKLGVDVRATSLWQSGEELFPGIGEEFMPSLDEGSYLLMPTSMPHAGMEENIEVLKSLDLRVSTIPEIDMVVGKLGRVGSALDPAPISMYENIINYKPEYAQDEYGRKLRFKVDDEERFLMKSGDALKRSEIIALKLPMDRLVQDDDGEYFRNWRDHITSPQDIWDEIVRVTRLPGVTSAPKLQPIETRLVMLQTGMRAPMGMKIAGPDLKTIEKFGLEIEKILKTVDAVKAEAVFAERMVGKPYIEIKIDRYEIARYGLTIENVQQVIETGIGGMPIDYTVEGRERYPVRIRYPRELRDDPQDVANILVATTGDRQVLLGDICEISYTQGPQMIKSEDTFLTGYVLFDKNEGFSEVQTVERAGAAVEQEIAAGRLSVPAGVSYRFSGSYENQVRAEQRLQFIIPVVLLIILLIMYMQFRSLLTSLMVFAGILMAFGGGFMLLWLYGQSWFIDFDILSISLREVFQVDAINLSIAVWVGFIALFGIATDDGVLMATYLEQHFADHKPKLITEVREGVVEAAQRRIRPAMMTTATTLIALLPVLTSTGKGSDIMRPMAIPIFGGMCVAIITVFIVPVLYSWRQESKLKNSQS